jgi:hypothetical protein
MQTSLPGLTRRLQRATDTLAMVASLLTIGACYVVIIIGGAIVVACHLAPTRS